MLSFAPAALYLVATVIVSGGINTEAPDQRARQLRAAALIGIAAALFHLTVLIQQAIAPHGLDLNFFAALSAVSGAVALLCSVLILRRAQLAALGFAVFPLAAACLLAYALRGDAAASASAPTWQIQLHAALALLAYATLSVAALIAVMLWLQERALRRREFPGVLRVFPPLTLLEALLFRLIGAGFALLTLALLSGVVFVENLLAQHLWHKTVFSGLAWLVFGTLLFGRWRYGWRGRRAVRLTLTAMLLLALAFFGSKLVRELILKQGVAAVTG